LEKKQNTLYVGSLAKGLRLLRAFDESHTELSLVELAARSGLDKSAVQRLANTLHIEGMVDMPTPGYSVKLMKGPVDRMQPPGLRFRMDVTPPDGMTTQVITPTKVRYSEPTPYSQIREIMISCADRPVVVITEVPVAQ